MTRYLQVIALSVLALLPVSCLQQQQHRKASEKKEKKVVPPLYLGTVHQLYPKINCALLRIIGPMPSAGSTLITHPADGSTTRIGNLCVTSEKPTSNGFIMAEVRSGSVMRGDRVFVYRDLSSVQEKEGEEETEAALQDLAPDLPSNTTVEDTEVEDGVAPTGDPIPGGTPATPQEPAAKDEAPATPTPTPTPAAKPGKKGPVKAPSYLDKIPDDINDWD